MRGKNNYDRSKKMRIVIYAPYLHVLGGGEKYIGSIAEILSARNTVDFIAFKKPNLEKIGKKLEPKLNQSWHPTINAKQATTRKCLQSFSGYKAL